jgi:hypothetical protein
VREKIFEKFGIVIFKTAEQHFIRYDSGEAVAKLVEDEISEKEAKKAQLSERDAYEVLLAIDRRKAK